MKDILTLLCIEYKVCSVSYFLDEMQFYELDVLTENLQLSYRQEWEQTRQICYVIAQTQSSKKLKPTDLMKFGWDNNTATKEPKEATRKEIERLKAKAKRIEETMKI